VTDSTVAGVAPRLARLAFAALAILILLAGTATATAARAAAAVLPATLLDTASTVWAYSDDNTDPATGSPDRLSWTTAAFDDSAWKTGTGALGAKNGTKEGMGGGHTVTTLLNQFIDGAAAPNVKTFHLRTGFDLTGDQLAAISSLTGTATYDDGVQIFVNGTKVAGLSDERVEAAPEAERNLTYAGSGAADPATASFSVPASALRAGENTVAVALYQDRETSSDIYFDLSSLVPVEASTPTKVSDIVLTIGADESKRNVTWYSDTDTAQVVEFARASDQTGSAFPADKATSSAATGGSTTSGEFRRSAGIEGLAENTAYVYRVGGDKTGWSDTYSFRTQSFSGDYGFLFFGDVQIGASGNIPNDQAGWIDTLKVAQAQYPDSEMLYTSGDQVDSANNEDDYNAFLAPEQLRELPLVPTIGNHDVGSKAYEQHFTVPNNDPNSGAAANDSSAGGDYWFTYKGVLYMNINTNNGDVASHKAFLENVVAEQGAAAKWKVVAFHHSVYSVAEHTFDQQILDLRSALPTIFSDLGIDLVLQGHDHSYTRSYLIKDGVRADVSETPGQSTVTAAPGQVLYVTANSSSGSKYYDVKDPNAWFASVTNQEHVRNYSHVEVTDDAITVTTLRSQPSGPAKPVDSMVDEVTVKRQDVTAPVLTVPATSSIAAGSTFDPMAGVTAVDAVDGDLTSAVTVAGTVDTSTLGSTTLTYSVTDAAGNSASATRVVTVVEGTFTPGTAPAISGIAQVGETLTATAGSWTPAPTTTTYQWLRDGKAIDGATAVTYQAVAADAGKALTVRESVTRDGYADASALSAAVTVLAADAPPTSDPTATPTPTPTPTPTASSTPTAVPTGADGSGSGSLASTGFGIAGGLTIAGLLVAAGAVFLVMRRRKQA
jgi:hypothetical protein